MPLARDFFPTLLALQTARHPWVHGIGPLLDYVNRVRGLSESEFFRANVDVEELHSQIEGDLLRAVDEHRDLDVTFNQMAYNGLVFMFALYSMPFKTALRPKHIVD